MVEYLLRVGKELMENKQMRGGKDGQGQSAAVAVLEPTGPVLPTFSKLRSRLRVQKYP